MSIPIKWKGTKNMKLNLGCGSKKIEGYINVDTCGEPDVCCDLNAYPWPWPDNSVDEVFSEHWLEHVDDYEKTILEIHRILKPDGIFWFKVPHYRSPMATWHLHKWNFSTYTPMRLCESLPYQWQGKQLFEKVFLRLNYIGVPVWFGRIMTKLANLSPHRWDWLGLPIEEIEFKSRKCL